VQAVWEGIVSGPGRASREPPSVRGSKQKKQKTRRTDRKKKKMENRGLRSSDEV